MTASKKLTEKLTVRCSKILSWVRVTLLNIIHESASPVSNDLMAKIYALKINALKWSSKTLWLHQHQRQSYKCVLVVASASSWIGHYPPAFCFFHFLLLSHAHTVFHSIHHSAFPLPMFFKFQHALHCDKLRAFLVIPLHNSLIINILHLGNGLRRIYVHRSTKRKLQSPEKCWGEDINSLEVSSTQI